MIKTGYLGPEGTFSHEALERYAQGMDYSPRAFTTIPDMLFAIRDGELDEAVVPIENSLEGAVNVTLDIMASEVDLKIRRELVLPIRQNLLVKKGTRLEDIKCILSHPQPIGQCRRSISKILPGAGIKTVYSTAGAALEVVSGTGETAAIGSVKAAEVYGLEILAKNIQDNDNNMTRFVVISEEDGERTGNDKTSIVFSTDNHPGSLYRVLDIFNLWDINMARIESRPAKNELGKYIFFVDINGHRQDEDIRDALVMIQRKTSFYKFLGSYPQFQAE